VKKYYFLGILLGTLLAGILVNTYLIYQEVQDFFKVVVHEETERIKSIVEGTLAAGGDPIEAVATYMQKSKFLKGATFSLGGRQIIIPGSDISNSYIQESFTAGSMNFTLFFDFSSLHSINHRVFFLLIAICVFSLLFAATLIFTLREYFSEKMRCELEVQEKKRLETINLVIHSLLHEVKNRLNTLRLLFYRLKKGFSVSLIEKLETELESLGKYIEETAELRRPLTLSVKNTNVRDAILEVIEKFEEIFKAKGISLEVKVESEIIAIDEEKLKSCLVDLIKNAVEALENKSKKQVKVFGKKEKGVYVIEVWDSGGVLPEVDLFKPFVSTKKQGLGLGLFNVKRIVEAHGGKVKAEVKSHYTVFRLEIPLNWLEIPLNFKA